MPVEYDRHRPYTLPGRMAPLSERRALHLPAIMSWPDMDDFIQTRFSEKNPELTQFYLEHKSLFRRFYNARVQIARGEGSEKLNKFNSRFMSAENKSKNPEMFVACTPILTAISATLSPKRTISARIR